MVAPNLTPADQAEQRQVAYAVLNDIFSNINEQLRFAEAKNGALITLNSAVVVAVITILADHSQAFSVWALNWLLAIAISCAIAVLVSLVSFMPEMRPRKTRPVVENPTNVFFFGHIRAHPEEDYLRMLFEGLGLSIAPLRAHIHLANQIGTNSQNANKKFQVFAAAAGLTLTAIVLSTLVFGLQSMIWRG